MTRMRKVLWIGLTGAIGISILVGCGGNYLPEKHFYQASLTLKPINEGKAAPQAYEKSIQAFQKVIERYPGSNQAMQSHFVIASLYRSQEKYGAARQELEKVIQNFSHLREIPSEARFQIAQLYQLEGDWEEALAAYQEVVHYAPLSVRGLFTPYFLANHFREKKSEVSSTNAAESSRLEQRMAQSYNEAISQYQKLVNQLGPISQAATVQNHQALTEASRGNWQGAVNLWVAIPDLFPKSPLGPISLLTAGEMTLHRLKDPGGAEKIFQAFIKRYPEHYLTNNAYFRLGMVYFFEGKYPKARETFTTLLERLPEDARDIATIRLLIGRCYDQEKKWKLARKEYKAVQRDFPETEASLKIPIMIGQHYLETGELTKADESFAKALLEYQTVVNEKHHIELRVLAEDLLNWVYAKQENWEKLIENLTMTVRTEGIVEEKKAHALYLLAYLYQHKLNQPARAIDFYEQFLRDYPDHALAAQVSSQLVTLRGR